ncbi:hypothetical protein Q5H93_07065 [Hymenobacter sp. ASUV-10]|uniref:Uncharacterized protein n=1 Tax=Hymenobacter aranciens TaxID=3063996 RepID=A0ABT9B8I8_9BACT|nr:hypothetical protein [Hymenobacter sp. ASUV-10]MDO7874487.1 hypothetical protein [Hymenobacter sp. ASUV-10]
MVGWLGLAASAAQAQNVGIGTIMPNAAAALDVTSTTQGLLPPRLTQAQRDAIGSPVAGLVVYQTDNTPGLYAYDGMAWNLLKADNLGNHSATQNLALNSTNDLLLRGGTDTGHGLGYYGYYDQGFKPWGGSDNVDGPVLFGYGGGRLGVSNGGRKTALTWTTDGTGVAVGLVGNALLLNGLGDYNHRLQYSGTYDGPQLLGYGGGSLGSDNAPNTLVWKRNGDVGLGTDAPNQRLDVRGNANVDGNLYVTNANVVETGAGILSKEYNAGKIGYRFLSADALDITGAADGSYLNRRIKFYSEGGAELYGSMLVSGDFRTNGRVTQRSYDSGDGAVAAGSGTSISGGAITLGAYAGGSFTWTHGLGFAPVVIGSIDQTGGGFADYVQWSYTSNGTASTTFYFTNRSGNTATFRLHWITVN